MPSSLIYLLGYPGVGKLTIAREINRQSGAIVVDNQLINTPIMALFAWDGVAPMPPAIWDHIAPIRQAVFDTLTELTPRSLSYVLTNVLEDTAEGQAMFDRVASIAARREAVFVPVHLSCAIDEELRRVAQPERAERLKTRDGEGLRRYMMTQPMLIPNHPNAIRVDTTRRSPADAAATVLAHVAAMSR